MTYLALALVAALVVVCVGFAQVLRSMQRQHGRREDLLLNQLLHATGKPWQPAPADAPPELRDSADVEDEQRYVASPEQFV